MKIELSFTTCIRINFKKKKKKLFEAFYGPKNAFKKHIETRALFFVHDLF